MSLFQNSVLASYKQDEALIASRWAAYQNFLAKTKAIREFKEEEYQEGFLKDVFESCLGYTLKTTDPANFTLERETKNETDSKKADGAIYVGDKVTGVIELKAQNTQNLDKATDQAFGYLTKNSHAKYVIVSNFDELRFYVEKATDYEKFHLFTLDYEGFKKLHLILSYESIAKELPHAMKQKSHNFEQEISKQLYKDFSAFRTHLFENILKNNDLDHTTLLRLTQKLCDRIIFILFAEDRGLLNPNTIKEIRSRHADDIMGNPIYGYYKIYFDAINKGNEKLAIPKYNGGLFAPDALLESLVIDDAYLDMEAQKLSDYDFASDISVNILGHIFEQSLTDLEELQAQIENADFDKKQGKRKKDGVFYTPEYITRYIVGNTLGRLCEEKKVALSLLIEAPAIANPKKLTKEQEKHKQNILDYRAWLENLKILDPACGSGAFLNQALEFLIREHTAVRDRLLPFQDLTLNYEIETAILEHNLYGVDINEDAVEIARLSLWLRTAQRGRTLTDLSGKIVCANSLLAMPFEEGSFDIVIGNPPYFNIQKFGAKSPIVQTIQTTYSEIWQDKSDILFYFIALAIKMTKNKVGFIISNAFMFSDKAKKLRNYILENTTVSKITNFEQYMVFEDASITSAIIELDKIKTNKRTKAYNFIEKNYNQSDVYDMLSNKANYFEVNLKKDNVFALVDDKINTLNEKIDSSYSKLNTIFKIGKGMETAANNVFQFKEYPTKFPKEFIKKRMSGEIIKKYTINETKEYLLYFEDITTFEELPQSIQNHLLKNKEFLENRAQIKRSKTSNWWKYTFPMHKEFYSKNKLWCSYRAKENIFCFDNTAEYIGFTNTTVIFDTHESLDLKYLLALLNSKTLNFRYKSIGKQTGSGVYEYFENGVGKLPIPEIDRERQQPFIKLVDEILEVKQKIKDYKTLFDEAHNTNNFDREIKLKKEIEILESRAMACEHEIDAMVYKLYNLTDEEIKIVENSNER